VTARESSRARNSRTRNSKLNSNPMPPRLILNADDFGLTPGINRAIAELHVAGCLTSATLMATGPAFDDAVRIARHQPTLGIGCHIVLVDGTPVLPPETLPTLCPNGRTFRPRLTDFARDVLIGRIEPDEIQSEAAAQIRRIQEAGIYPTHLDTHKHAHIFTRVAKALYLAAQRTGVRAIRNPFEPRHIHSHALLKRRIEIAALHLLPPTARSVSPRRAASRRGPSAESSNPSPPTARTSLSAIPATTMPTSRRSARACASIVKSSFMPCSTKFPES
jgi:predicted glycoside hydrolase/deacetylase ChbG (UPF0249 family)